MRNRIITSSETPSSRLASIKLLVGVFTLLSSQLRARHIPLAATIKELWEERGGRIYLWRSSWNNLCTWLLLETIIRYLLIVEQDPSFSLVVTSTWEGKAFLPKRSWPQSLIRSRRSTIRWEANRSISWSQEPTIQQSSLTQKSMFEESLKLTPPEEELVPGTKSRAVWLLKVSTFTMCKIYGAEAITTSPKSEKETAGSTMSGDSTNMDSLV